MAHYQYYQTGAPQWGTNQYQFMAPPVPNYVPQPSWTGYDYYSAHADAQDSTLFDYVWSKVRSAVTGGSVSRGEAEHWHRRIYGGLVSVSGLLPREIGAAAGWETLRLWQSHSSIYRSPLSGEREREREAIVGLAIAEASRLWQYTGRPLDKYGRREASEMAAATASRVFMQLYDYDTPYDSYNSYDGYRDPYRSRRRSSSFYDDGGSVAGGYGQSIGSYRSPSPIPIPGSVSPYGAPGMLPGGSPYAGGGSPYVGGGSPYAGGGSPYAGATLLPGGGASPYGSPMPLSGSPYQSNFYGQPGLSYDQQQNAMAAPPGTVVIHTGSDSGHRHRHRSRSHSRHGHHHHRRRSSGGGYYADY